MVFMTAGMLDHRNIGSHITLPYGLPGAEASTTVAGAIALIVQDGTHTEIFLTGDDESILLEKSAQVEVNLPPAAAYTLHMKNAVEELLAAIKGGPALRVAV